MKPFERPKTEKNGEQWLPNHPWCPNGRLDYGISEVIVCLLVGCLTSQQQASVSQGRICSDNFTCCHTEIEVADPTFYLTQSQYTDTGPTSPSADPITPGASEVHCLSTTKGRGTQKESRRTANYSRSGPPSIRFQGRPQQHPDLFFFQKPRWPSG